MKQLTDFEYCAKKLKALADKERLRIVECLLAGPKNVGEVAAELDEEIVKVSHHLGVLRDAELVQSLKQGRFVVYELHPDVSHSPATTRDTRSLDLGCCKLNLKGR
jgi:ArsR family transcriptional regulator